MMRRTTQRQFETAPPETSARDPIEWAIIAVVISGSSLILALEKKFEDRRRAQSAAAAEKARAGNRLRLGTIRAHLNEISMLLRAIPDLGRLEVDPNNSGISRNSITFSSDANEERFSQNFDRLTALIGRINRLLSEIDPQGLPLTDEDVRRFVTEPMQRAQEKVLPILQANADPRKRIERAHELVEEYANLIADLERALGGK
jgi:hypothetical protein